MKFKLDLDDIGQIHLKINDKENYIMSRTMASSLRYELYQIIGKKAQWHQMNDWKPEGV